MKFFTLLLLFPLFLSAQNGLFEHKETFTKQDSLRGSITPEREWWNLKHYELTVELFPKTKTIKGSNTICFEVLKPAKKMQIDLQEPLQITHHGQEELLGEKTKKETNLLLHQTKGLEQVFGGQIKTIAMMNLKMASIYTLLFQNI